MREIAINHPTDVVFFRDTLTRARPYAAHTPRDHESLFFVTKGNLLYRKGNEKTVVATGQVGYIAKGSVDTSEPYLCDEVSYIAVNFSFDMENTFWRTPLPFATLCADTNAYSPFQKLFELAEAEFNSQRHGWHHVVNGLLLEIIGHLYREYEKEDTEGQDRDSLGPIVEYIKTHCHEPSLQIRDAVRTHGMSERNFRRLFKKHYGIAPYDFLQGYRIERAEVLLRHSPTTVSEIAYACGFADVYSFSHCFKKHTGLSPLSFRRAWTGRREKKT